MENDPSRIGLVHDPSDPTIEQTPATPKRIERRPLQVRLAQILLLSLAFLLVIVVVLSAMLILVDLGQRRRIARDQSALSGGGSYLTINNALIHYRQAGPVTDPLALIKPEPPLVLIHGLMGSSQDFEFIQPQLASDRTVIAVDLIGFGLSDKSSDLNYSKKSMAEMIAGLMNRLGHDQFDVLGHSMGGEVALHLALDHGDKVSRLILLDSAGLSTSSTPAHGSEGPRMARSPMVIDLVFKNTFLEKTVFRNSLHDPKPYMPLAFEKLYYFVEKIPPQTLARFIADSDSGAISGRIHEISQPTQIIWGEQDRIIPVAQAEALHRQVPESRLDIITECGHLPYLEQPEELTRLILEFLDGS